MPGRMNNNASYSSAPDAAFADAASALRNNDIARAEALVRTCLSADPENVEALRLLAGVAASTGYSTDAEKLLRRAVESAPAFILAYADLASLLCRLNRADEAIALLDDVIEDPSRRLWALSLKTTILTGERRVEEALNVHEDRKSTRLNSSH